MSNIKGGGRASLSDEAEQALVSLLLHLQHRDVACKLSNKHDRKVEHKRFVKKLVQNYTHTKLVQTLNVGTNNNNNNNVQPKSTARQLQVVEAAAARNDPVSATTGSGSDSGSTKVRIELVEAVYGGGCKNSNKNKSKSKSSHHHHFDFKEGAIKKVMVFPRSTSIAQILGQAKSKLRMKKAPNRCFVVQQKIQVDLLGDLRGLEDGATVYLSSHVVAVVQAKADDDKKNRKPEEMDSTTSSIKDDDAATSPTTAATATTTSEEEEEDHKIDPLDAVKQAYAQQRQIRAASKRRNPKSIRKREPNMNMVPHPHPCFSDHFDKLPTLSQEQADLPAASCRERILQAVDTSRVVIICGATGCGKSTQVPQYLVQGMTATAAGGLDHHNHHTHVLVTQPRRVAATSLAARVAQEMETPPPGTPGSLVGYNIRLDRAVSDEAQIVYCTVGILVRMLVCPQEGADEDNDNKDKDKDLHTVPEEDGQTEKEKKQPRHVPLSHISHVVIDEVHERDLNTDFALTLLRIVLATNKNIRIILMSATASADLFVRYFRSDIGMEPTVIKIPGRSYPVDIKWITDCEQVAASRVQGWLEKKIIMEDTTRGSNNNNDDSQMVLSPRAATKIDNHFLRDLIRSIVREQQTQGKLSTIMSSNDGDGGKTVFRKEGAVLVFLPGKAEIESLAKVLYDDSTSLGDRDFCKILKLHSSIPRGEQQAVFRPAKEGTVKVVLATNIAETSITIPDVSHVIDTGRVKESRFNASTRIKELVTVWTSNASAKQRAGRAGRTTAGVCWRLYSEDFSKEWMPPHTSPEILRTPLDELVMQVCLLYEHRRDEERSSIHSKMQLPHGVCPIRFLNRTPEPPPEISIVEACKHLLEVDALTVSTQDPHILYRLTPLGYHLSRLPMDAKVGKVLIVGCMLGCLDGALTIAAALSTTKSCFPSRWGNSNGTEWEEVLKTRTALVESGFGGLNWLGGNVKGDLIASIAAYNQWATKRSDKERGVFASKNGLDNLALKEMHSLRRQYEDCLKDAGFLTKGLAYYNKAKDDALLTSCCLVAGMYPNICTLTRPRKGGPKGGRLLTKDGDECRPSSSSFQMQRIRNAAEDGKDAYAVFHAKHRSVGTGHQRGEVFLSEVNFVSRFALLLFGGELEVQKNALIVDGWLKFKVGEKGTSNAILIQELRNQLDNIMVGHIVSKEKDTIWEEDCQQVVDVVRQLLAQE